MIPLVFTCFLHLMQIQLPEVNMMIFQGLLTNRIIAFISSIMQSEEFDEILTESRKCVEQLTFELSDQICQIMEESRNYIIRHIKELNEHASSSFILNKYVMHSLFLELAHSCHKTLQELLEYTIFHYADPDISDKFIKLSITDNDLFILKNSKIAP